MTAFVVVWIIYGFAFFAAGIWLGFHVRDTPERVDLGNAEDRRCEVCDSPLADGRPYGSTCGPSCALISGGAA